jgi:hypothetical protein
MSGRSTASIGSRPFDSAQGERGRAACAGKNSPFIPSPSRDHLKQRTLCLSLLLLTACGVTKPIQPTELPPDLALERVTVRQYRGSQPQLVATAASLGLHREGAAAGQVIAKTVGLDLVANGLHVDAQRVTGDALGGVLQGEVVHAITSSGALVDSPLATLDRNLGEGGTASSDAGIHVTHPSMTLDARAGSFELGSERAELQDVKSTFRGR